MKGPSPLNYTHQISLVLVIFSGLYLGISAVLNKNLLLELLLKLSSTNYKTILRVIYFIFGIAALYLILFTTSNTFLPFLDKTVLPPSLLLLSEQSNTNLQIKLDAPDAIKVIYWAAKPDTGKVIDDPFLAYDDYENIGIAAVKDDVAILKLFCPTAYKVGSPKTTLSKHLHFRFVYANGVLSEVKTLKLDKQCKK
jgi:uncharacterized membrane protein YuzA (DUF378 family)